MPKVDLTVVGMQFRLTMQYRNHLRSRASRLCFLRREPDNEHDPNAIMVILKSNGIHIGYLQRDVAVAYAPLMDTGRIEFTKVKLTDVDPPAGEGYLQVQFKRVSKKT